MKNKLNKKILLSFLLAIVLIGNLSQTYAFSIGQKQIVCKGVCETLMTYRGVPIKTSFVLYEENGVQYPAYCLDVTLPGAESGSYIVNGGSKIQDVNVWRAVTNGYPYKSLAELGAANDGEAFTATKQAVYTLMENRNTGDYGPINSDAGRRTYQIYLNIVNAARNSAETIQNNLVMNIKKVSEEWKVDNVDKKCVSKTYTVESNISSGSYQIFTKGAVPNGTIVTDIQSKPKSNFKVGEQFKILIPIQNLEQSNNFTIEAKGKLDTKPVVYGSTTVPGTQDYALTGYMYEEISNSSIEDYFKNITKIVVVKKEYATEKRLEGVKFNLLDENKKVVKEGLITNEKGEIMLENMIPGKYYLQETETLENYNLYTDLIEINLDLNEEFQVKVNNTIREVTKIDKDFENVEVIPEFTETVYNVNTKSTIIKKLPVTGY